MSEDLDSVMNELTRPSGQAAEPVERVKRATAKTYEANAAIELRKAAGEANQRLVKHNRKPALQSRAREDAFKNFEEAVGGRAALAAVMEHCPKDGPAYKGIAKLFSDYDFTALGEATLASICFRQGISLAQLMMAFKDATIAKHVVQSIAILSEHVPAVVAQIADDSTNRYAECVVCMGEGRIPRIGDNGEFVATENGDLATQLCYECRGTGSKYKEHDFANRRVFLEITGIIDPAKKGIQVNQAFIAKGDFAEGTFEGLIKNIDNTQATEEPPLDVETVPYAVYDAEGATDAIMSPDPAQVIEADPAEP